MSNNSAQEKTEDATPQKLRKSREDGQVTRSKDLSTTVSLIATLLILKMVFSSYYHGLEESFRISFLNFHSSEITQEDLGLILSHNMALFVKILAPLLLTSVLVVVFSLIPGAGCSWPRISIRNSASSTRSRAWGASSRNRTGSNCSSRWPRLPC